MAKSIIPKFQLNLDSPGLDKFRDYSDTYSFNKQTADFLKIPEYKRNQIAAVAAGDFSDKTKNFFEQQGLELDKAKQQEYQTQSGLGQAVKSTLAYWQKKLTEGTTDLLGNVLDIPDTTFRIMSQGVGAVANPIIKALGGEAMDWNKSQTERLSEIAKLVGLNINTNDWRPSVIKNYVDDLQSGKNPVSSSARRVTSMIGNSAESDLQSFQNATGKSGAGVQFVGDVLKNIPQTAIYAAPGGAMLGSFSAISGGVNNALSDAQALNMSKDKALQKGLLLGEIDAYSELIFGLFGEVGSLIKSPTSGIAAKGLQALSGASKDVAGKLAKTTVGRMVVAATALLATGAEEGAEEVLAYPFSQYVQWQYDNPQGKFSDFFSWKDMGYAGLVGMVSGALLGSVDAVRDVRALKQKERFQKAVDNLNKMGETIAKMDTQAPDFQQKAQAFVEKAAAVKLEIEKEQKAEGIAPTAKTPVKRFMQGQTLVSKNMVNKQAQNVPDPTLIPQVEPEGPPPADAITPEEIPVTDKYVAGKSGKTITEQGTEIDFDYALANQADIKSSFDTGYDQTLQPRNTDRKGSDLAIQNIIKEFDPARLGENRIASVGAPIVGPDMQVEAGNHRVAAIRSVLKNKKTAQQYTNWLKQNAEKFGFTPDQVTGDTVLVRVRKTDVDRQRFVQEANVPPTAQMSSTEKAETDATRITTEMLAYFNPTDDGEINNAGNMEFIRRFVNDVIPPTERNANMQADGMLSQDGIARVRNALFLKAYGNTRLLSLVAESTSSNVKNLTNAMVALTPKVIQMKADIEAGTLYDVDVSSDIALAAEEYVKMKQAKTNVLIYAKQQEMGESIEQIRAKKMLLAIASFGKSSPKIRQFFADMIDTVTVAGNPKDVGLFGALGAPIKDDIIEVALRRNQVEQASKVESEDEDGQYSLDEIGQNAQPAEQPVIEQPVVEQGQVVEPAAEVRPEPKKESAKGKTVKKKTPTEKPVEPKVEKPVVTKAEESAKPASITAKVIKGQKVTAVTLDHTPTDAEKTMLVNNGFKHDLKTGEWYVPQGAMTEKEVTDLVSGMTRINDIPTDSNDLSGFATPESEMPNPDIMGIVDPTFMAMFNNNPPATEYKGTLDPEVNEKIGNAGVLEGTSRRKITWERIKEGLSDLTLGDVLVPRDLGDLRVAFEKFRSSGKVAVKIIGEYLKMYQKLSDRKYTLMCNYILFGDMANDINRGLYNKQPLPSFIPNNSKEFVMNEWLRAKEAVALTQNEDIRKALDARTARLTEVRDKLIKAADKIGMNLEYLKNRDMSTFLHHAVLEYLKEQESGQKKKGKAMRYQKRKGGIKEYMTDIITADFIIMRKMLQDSARVDLAYQVAKLDKHIGDDDPIPDGYAELHMSDFGLTFSNEFKQISQTEAAQARIDVREAKYREQYNDFIKNQAKMTAEDRIKETSRLKTLREKNNNRKARDLARAKHVASDRLVVPIKIAEAVRDEFRTKGQHSIYADIAMTTTGGWKTVQLLAPHRFFKVGIKNLFGDAEGVLLTYPKTFTKVGQALQELWNYYKHSVATKDMIQYISMNGMDTGITDVELENVNKFIRNNSRLLNEKDGFKIVTALRDGVGVYFKGAKKASEFREQILRYACFLHLKDELHKSENGLPKFYGASVPREIQGISDIDQRAFKLSQDAVGNYQDVTELTAMFGKFLGPFVRFTEVNTKRYFRVLKNSFYDDPNIAAKTGMDVASKFGKGARVTAFAVMRLGKFALMYGLLQGLLEAWNRLVMGWADDQLPEDIKNSSHITIGMINGRVRYLSDLSSVKQFFSIAGIDGKVPFYSDVMEVLSGKKTWQEKVNDMLFAPVNTFINSLNPAIKAIWELPTGKSSFPDARNPSTIRDKWEYIFKNVGMENLYKQLAGKPMQDGSYFKTFSNVVFNSVYTGDAALWDIYDLKEQFLKEQGIWSGDFSVSKDPKKMAIYYYKQALKMNDTEAAISYLQKYVAAGGTYKTYRQSIKALDPLYNMKGSVQEQFREWLDEDDRKKLDIAIAYMDEVRASGEDIEAEVFK